MGITDGPERRKYGTTRMVINYVVQQALHDELWAVEEDCLKELVERVHEDGRKGETWPEVESRPYRWTGGKFGIGELVPCGIDEVMEWRVAAECWTVPR